MKEEKKNIGGIIGGILAGNIAGLSPMLWLCSSPPTIMVMAAASLLSILLMGWGVFHEEIKASLGAKEKQDKRDEGE